LGITETKIVSLSRKISQSKRMQIKGIS